MSKKTACEKLAGKTEKEKKYECRNCGLASAKEKHLCKPKKVKKK
jgi:hypothetical protein